MNRDKPVSYWEKPSWFESRNKQILKDKEEGLSIVELVTKYGITPTRLHYIVKREGEKNGNTQ